MTDRRSRPGTDAAGTGVPLAAVGGGGVVLLLAAAAVLVVRRRRLAR